MSSNTSSNFENLFLTKIDINIPKVKPICDSKSTGNFNSIIVNKNINKKESCNTKNEPPECNLSDNSDLILKNNYISKNDIDFILRAYYRIIESICIYTQIYYNIVLLCFNYFKLLILLQKKNIKNEDIINDIKKRKEKIDLSINTIEDILKNYNIFLDKDTTFSFNNFIKLQDNDNITRFKKYCEIEEIETYKNIRPIIYCNINNQYCYSSSLDKFKYFNKCVVDKYRLRYNKNIALQKNQLSFYQSICQPLNIKKDGDRFIPEYYNNQVKTDDNAPNNTICKYLADTNIQYNVKNKCIPDKSVEYQDDLYLPNLTSKTLVKYSPALRKYLVDNPDLETEFKNNILKQHDYQSAEGSEKKSLEEQIKFIEEKIKSYNKVIIKYRSAIIMLKSGLAGEYRTIKRISGNDLSNILDIKKKKEELESLNKVYTFLSSLGLITNEKRSEDTMVKGYEYNYDSKKNEIILKNYKDFEP